MSNIKSLCLVDGSQLIGEVAFNEGKYSVRKPYKLFFQPLPGGEFKIALQPFPIHSADEIIEIHRSNVITVCRPSEAMEDLFIQTSSPIDLTSKLEKGTGDRKAR